MRAKPRLLTSRKFQPGSRRVVVLSLLRQPDVQINYGTGKDVSDETIADAREPLKVQWFGDSFIKVPVCGAEEPCGMTKKTSRR